MRFFRLGRFQKSLKRRKSSWILLSMREPTRWARPSGPWQIPTPQNPKRMRRLCLRPTLLLIKWQDPLVGRSARSCTQVMNSGLHNLDLEEVRAAEFCRRVEKITPRDLTRDCFRKK